MINKFIKIILIIIIFNSIFSSSIFVKPVKSLSSDDYSTFYFKDVLGINSEPEYDSNLGLTVLVSDSSPSKVNDSYYPPQLFDGLKLNSEEWITWFSTTWLFYFIDDLSGEYDDLGDLFDSLEILFPNPLRIVETYEYNGNESININGNVDFNLYLSSKLFSKISSNDKVNVGIYSLNPESLIPIPIKISNKTVEINPELFQDIKMLDIMIENINYTLDNGESLLFEIELIPGNKTILDLLKIERPLMEVYRDKALEFLRNLANNTEYPTLDDIVEIIDMIDDIVKEINISKEDALIIINSLISTSLVYDSVSHPTSVSVPFYAPTEDNGENSVTYYLYSDNKMYYQLPDSDEASSYDLTNPIIWDGPKLNRSKILKDANAVLYVNYKDINYFADNIKINGKLIYNSQEIGSSEFILDKTQILSSSSIIPVNMFFDNIQDLEEIAYNSSISLQISLDNNTDFGRGTFRKAELLYESIDYPSRISLNFIETDHIKLDIIADPEDYKIIPGDSVKFLIDVYSELNDEIEIVELSYLGNKDYWNIQIPSKASISSGNNATFVIYINSTKNDLISYGEEIEIKFSIQGKTGKVIFEAYAEISEDAVEYDFSIIAPPGKDIKHGSSGSYLFIIKNNNTGLWPDSYTLDVKSENDWNLSIKPSENINNLGAGESIEVNITLYVPKDIKIKKDKLTLIVNSDNSNVLKTVNITTNIVGANLLENLYNYFESLAYDLGLDDIFGEFGPHALALIIFILIFFFIILIVFLITAKYVSIICLDRVKKISPDQIGKFDITLKNPTKKSRNYKLNIISRNNSIKWIIKLIENKVSLNPKETKNISYSVTPTDMAKKNDWGEFDFIVKTIGKRKIEKITTMIVLENSISNLSIIDVWHSPRLFKGEDKINTSFKIINKGNVASENIDIILLLNGEEKNKVVDIIIPAEGYADINIPWIAVKGKNEISIVVKKK